jgi:hypothetical protein
MSNDAEQAVRNYLTYLEDPTQLRDEAAIRALTVKAAEEKDPIAKLRALGDLERASAVDGGTYRDAFVRHAKAWAAANGVPVGAFRSLKVPEDALAAAGFDVGARRGRRSGGRSTTRSGRVTIAGVKSATPSGVFTIRMLEDASGGSPGTVRKALAEMVAQGAVKDLGSDPAHAGRGRAPTLYQKA